MNNDYNVSNDTWVPEPHQIEQAQVTAFGRNLHADYDACTHFHCANRLNTGKVRCSLGIHWRRSPYAYVDVSAGDEFARWFPGGELNWVETVLLRGEKPDRGTPGPWSPCRRRHPAPC